MEAVPVKVLVLFGATAAGKTGVLFELSKKIPIEVISADSMQVYRGMDIGTAKPTADEIAQLPHHLINIRDPKEQFNVGDFVRCADEACCLVFSRGKLPVVSGGTGFYLKNFIQGLSKAPPSDEEIRAVLKQELREKGAASLRNELALCDPTSASRIHQNDEYRMLRALEVYRSCGRPLSSFEVDASVDSRNYQFIIIGLSRPREELYRRINERCDSMFKLGLPEEVRLLFDAGYTPDDPGLRAIGYREFFIENETPSQEIYGDGTCGQKRSEKWKLSQDIAGIKALVAQNSRRYAKRQITFFARLQGINWIEPARNDKETAMRILSFINIQSS